MKEGWEYNKLEDICTIVGRIGFRGYTKADLVESPNDGAITLSPSNIINGELDFSNCTYISWNKYNESPEIMLEIGDVVLVKTASIGKCAVVKKLPHKATLNPQFVVLKGITGEPNFIGYYLKSPVAQTIIKQMAGGVAIPTLSQKKLGTMLIPSSPLSEQQAIVDYLDSAFAKIDAMKANAEKALNEAKALFQASLKEMLEPKEGWEEKKLEDICTHIVDCPHNTPRKVNYPTLYPCIRTSEIKEGKIKWNSMQYLDEEEYNVRTTRIKPMANDIVYGREGSYGDAVLLPEGYNFSLGQRTMLFRPDTKSVLPKFLHYSVISTYVYEQAKAKNSGCGVGHVNVKDIKLFIIGIPKTLSEQQTIVTTLDTLKSKVDRLLENYDKISQECDALKQAILRQVFE